MADARLLTLSQWLSPAYPTGAFAYSHGLEQAVRAGWVRDAASLSDWLRDLLHEGTGRADAIWLYCAHAARTRAAVEAIDAEARAFAASAERLREGARQGAAFARVTADVWGLDLGDWLLPVALGRAAGLLGLEVTAAAALHLQSTLANLAAAAQRLMPLGQTDAQRIVAALAPDCAGIARETRGLGPCDVAANAWMWDVAAMRHETLEPRIFQS